MAEPPTEPCRFGYVEHDGDQYCFAHGGWHHYTTKRQRCDRAEQALNAEQALKARRAERETTDGT